MKIFLPQSGNLGDTSNILPVLSGYFKDTGDRIMLGLRPKMATFKGVKELFDAQDCIESISFMEIPDRGYKSVYLSDVFKRIDHRPMETNRYAISFEKMFRTSCDDAFELKLPKYSSQGMKNKVIVADRTNFPGSDTRRKFGILKFLEDIPGTEDYYRLDYSDSIGYNLNLIKESKHPVISTFTGISILIDLMWKNQLVVYGDDMANWQDKPVDFSFERHYYTNRYATIISKDTFESFLKASVSEN